MYEYTVNERGCSYMILLKVRRGLAKRRRLMTREYDGFAAVYDRLMADVDYNAWADYLSALLQNNGVLPGSTVLDAACGTGEITLHLHKKGYILTGADRAETMLEIAQQKARKAGARIPFVCQDLRALSVHQPVSAITCACDGVNYLLSGADLTAFFSSANRALKECGLLLFDISSAYKLEHVLGGQTFGDDDPDCTFLWQNCFDPKTHLLEMNLSFFVPDGAGKYTRFSERHIQRAHTVEELTVSLDGAGFELVCVYDAFSMNAPNEKSERIQFAARKRGKGATK